MTIQITRKKWLILVICSALILAGGFYVLQKQNTENGCLSNNKIVKYKIEEKKDASSNANVVIEEKNTGKLISEFQINNIIPNHYHGYEIHKCNIYAVREFNFDYKKGKALPDFRMEIWKYNYNGIGQKLVEENDFRVSPNEEYVSLIKSYFGKDDYALIIKDINTKQDVFMLLAKEIFKQYPNIIGSFNMREWSKDGRYFWGDTFDGAYVNGYFRIDALNWNVNIYEAPDGAMGGFPLNVNTGYVPIQPGQVWTGDYQLTRELKEQYKKEGKKSQLYLYNLFTKEKILIETIDEPLWLFKPQWLSNTELQYEMPTGEKKIYKLNEK